MSKTSGLILAALLLLCSHPSPAQKTAPKAAQKKAAPLPGIRFQGATQYSTQELLDAAGLKPDAHLTPAEVKAHAKLLSDTGLFKEITFVSTAKSLVFTLIPAPQLYPMHLDNIPLTPGKDLDALLSSRFPLYHGLLPTTGSIVDGICQTFSDMLAAKGVKATVKATLTSGLGPQKLTAMNFAIDSPPVHIGRIQLVGVSPAVLAKANLLASGQTGNPFDTENTTIGLQHVFQDFYQQQSYAAVQVAVTQLDPIIGPDQSLEVPYKVTVNEGGVYKLGTIDYPATALVPRAEVDKLVAKTPANSGRPLDLFLLAVCDAYHARGYLDCAVATRPSFTEATHIVNYALDITPGSQYRLGSVKFDGAPDPMAAKLKLAWKLAPAAIFDESYLSNFVAQAQKKDKALAKWIQTVIITYDTKPDPATHQVNCILHFAKAAQTPR